MSLKFDRKAFTSGILKVYEPIEVDVVKKRAKVDANGDYVLDGAGNQVMEDYATKEIVQKRYVFQYRDKGKVFDFIDEDYILARYPVLFTKV